MLRCIIELLERAIQSQESSYYNVVLRPKNTQPDKVSIKMVGKILLMGGNVHFYSCTALGSAERGMLMFRGVR